MTAPEYSSSYIELTYTLYRPFGWGIRQISGDVEDCWKSAGLDIRVPIGGHLSDRFSDLDWLIVRSACDVSVSTGPANSPTPLLNHPPGAPLSNLILLIVCFVAGIALRKSGRFTADAHLALNAVIVNLSLPAMALLYLHRLKWDPSILPAIAMPWAVFMYAVGLFILLGRYFQWRRDTTGALILVAGLGNTSFVGIPMIEALYGKGGAGLGLAIDQCGSYLVLSTLGLIVAAQASGTGNSVGMMVRRVFTFPPFIAMTLAILLIPVAWPAFLNTLFQRMADTVTPLALLSVGMQIRLTAFRENRVPLAAGLGFKLLLAPALVWCTYLLAGQPMGDSEKIVMLEAAMGPMIGASIVATHHNLNNRLVTMMVGLGIPLCLISAPLIMLLVR